jgi:hypothetical protein
VRLVAGGRLNDAGVRVAELCGVRSTIELADLTREIFDLALVGERSPRRGQVERLLNALGTPIATPRSFLDAGARESQWDPSGEAGHESHAINGSNRMILNGILAHAIPDLATAEEPDTAAAPLPSTPGDVPRIEDRPGLERALARWITTSGAIAAELRAGPASKMERLCGKGANDPLLETLIAMAIAADSPQVVTVVVGPDRGRVWGAWPFRTHRLRGVLAAASVDSMDGRALWAQLAQEIAARWQLNETDRAAPRPPRVPAASEGWLAAPSFRARLELAVERNRRDGLRFAVHRIHFSDHAAQVEEFCRGLPEGVRGTDFLCRSAPRDILMLSAGPPGNFVHVRRRLIALWERVWRDRGELDPAPALTDERIELVGPESAQSFLGAADGWLAGS